MEEKKIQSEQLNLGVDGIVKTLVGRVQGSPEPLKALSLLEVAGVDRSKIEDNNIGLSSKEKVIVNLIEALKRNLILEDKQRRTKEHLYQKKLDDLFTEVRELKSAMLESTKTSQDDFEYEDESTRPSHLGEPVTGTQRSSSYLANPTKSSRRRRHKKIRHHHRRHHLHPHPYHTAIEDEDIEDSPITAAASITPSAASVVQMYKGILDSENANPMMNEGFSGQENFTSGQNKSSADKQENKLLKIQDKSFTGNREDVLYGQDQQLQQTVNEMNSKSYSISHDGNFEHKTMNPEEKNTGRDSKTVTTKQIQELTEDEIKHNQEKSTDLNESEAKDRKTEELVKNVAQTDVPFVRLVKEEHQMKENVEPGSGDDPQSFSNNTINNNNDNKTKNEEDGTKQTVVNFRTDDLKALEENLFAAFEKRIKSKAFDGTIESLKGLSGQESGLARHLNLKSESQENDKSSEGVKEESKTVIRPQSFLERLKVKEEEDKKENDRILLTDQTSNQKVN